MHCHCGHHSCRTTRHPAGHGLRARAGHSSRRRCRGKRVRREGGHCRRSHRSFHFWSRMTKGESFCPSSRRPRRWRAICFLTFLHFAPFVSGVRFPLSAYTARPRHCQAAIFLSRTSPLITSISVQIMVFPWRGEEGEATGAATPRSLPAWQEFFFLPQKGSLMGSNGHSNFGVTRVKKKKHEICTLSVILWYLIPRQY